MKYSKTVVNLLWLIVLLALIAAGTGFWGRDEGQPSTFTTLRGQNVEIYGQGLYRYDSLFTAAGFRGQDGVTLFLGIPLLIFLTWLYRKDSRKSKLLLSGILAYFLYAYASMALSASYNNMFLVYVALLSASFYAFVLVFRETDLHIQSSSGRLGLPRRGPAAFMFTGGAVTLAVWLQPIITALIKGTVPAVLEQYTTLVTFALDLAIIVPATFISGTLIIRRDQLGYRIAFPLFGIILMLVPVIIASTFSQLSAGVRFTPGEIIGPIAGFLILGIWAAWVMISILRSLPSRRRKTRDRRKS